MSAAEHDWFLDDVLDNGDGTAARWTRWWLGRWHELDTDPAGRLARDQGFVLTTAQWRALGHADHDLRREIRRGHWSSPAYGTVSPVVVSSSMEKFAALRRGHALASSGAALVHPGQVISAASATVLHGLPTLSVPGSPQLTAGPDGTLGRRSAAHVYGATLPASSIASWFGAPVTDIARTIVDQARHDRRDGLIAADAALHESLVTAAALDAALADAVGWPGVRQAREIVALADGRAESPLESLTRLALHDDGFPPVVPQVHIGGYRVDLLLPEQRLIIECDGLGKYVGDALAREKKRHHRLSLLGYRIERVIWEDILRLWPQTRLRLRAAL